VHEASAAEAILRIALAESGKRDGARVSKIRMVVGESRGYMKESLAMFLQAMAKGGPVEGAALEVEYVKTRLRCLACGLEFDRAGFAFQCPSCGGKAELTGRGDELYIDSLEIEEE
jgi:hydrogenase nickel incorporation protein HypA/HybF